MQVEAPDLLPMLELTSAVVDVGMRPRGVSFRVNVCHQMFITLILAPAATQAIHDTFGGTFSGVFHFHWSCSYVLTRWFHAPVAPFEAVV
jgi:hypothetical protein